MIFVSKLTTLTAKLAAIIALAISALGFASFSARAADDFYTFKSVLSSADANWCIDVPGAEFQSGKHLAVSGCTGKLNQTFSFESGRTLTVGGLCLDGIAGTPNQPPSAGDPVVIAECDGSDHQVWELQPFKNTQGTVAIANLDSLCVTVDGATIGQGTPLVLAQCAELATQGWVSGKTANAEPQYYSYSGHRYCWYDGGWHGGGWYWCGENFNRGVGWGGPIGWHWWHHPGHPKPPHPPKHPPGHPPTLKPPHPPTLKPPHPPGHPPTLKPPHPPKHPPTLKPPHPPKHPPTLKPPHPPKHPPTLKPPRPPKHPLPAH